MNLTDSIHTLNSWYRNDDVWRVAIQGMGSLLKVFHLEKGLQQLSDSANLWEAVKSTACEYVSVVGQQICEMKGKLGTGRSLSKKEFLSWYVNFENPVLELHQSVWQENCYGDANPLPKRVLFVLDIEYYNNRDLTGILLDQQAVFQAIEPTYRYFRKALLELGIDHIVVASGRGYNFLWSVPAESLLFPELLKIGGPIEESLAAKQKYPAFKRWRPVPWQAEVSFKGALRLVLFLAGLIIDEVRKHSNWLPVELSDQGAEGISLDVTMLTRGVDGSTLAVASSPYLKMHFQKNLNNRVVVENTPIPVRLIRARGNQENFPDFRKMIIVRNDYRQAWEHFAGQEGYIPDGSAGLANLIRLYRQSPLAYFHQMMDNEEHNPYWDWWKTYRNYEAICERFPHLADIIRHPNPALLEPHNLNRLINDFMDAGWHPKHVGGFIRALYEDWRLNWGNKFTKYDAAKWANGWVELLGAQRFFGMN